MCVPGGKRPSCVYLARVCLDPCSGVLRPCSESLQDVPCPSGVGLGSVLSRILCKVAFLLVRVEYPVDLYPNQGEGCPAKAAAQQAVSQDSPLRLRASVFSPCVSGSLFLLFLV